jgi:hypothetical protein
MYACRVAKWRSYEECRQEVVLDNFFVEVLPNRFRYICNRNVISSSECLIGATLLYHGMDACLWARIFSIPQQTGVSNLQRGSDMIMLNVSSCCT